MVRSASAGVAAALLCAVLAVAGGTAGAAPTGAFVRVSPEGVAEGWAVDLDKPSAPIRVHFRVDGPVGQGTFAGSATADQPWPDLEHPGNHGFAFAIPEAFRAGYREFHAYGIDPAGGRNALLEGSPRAIGTRPSGNAEISGDFEGSPIVIRTTERLAGAIGSLVWRGKEFVNDFDHGREMQSAAFYDKLGVCFNPTEAGAAADGSGDTSTSVLQALGASGNVLTTQTQLAFWLRPGERVDRCGQSSETRAVNTTPLSNHLLNKQVTIGPAGIPNAIEHQITFTVPEDHKRAIFEVLSVYMPPEFQVFWSYDPKRGRLERLPVPAASQPQEAGEFPLILSTADERHALGVYSPGLPQPAHPLWGYSFKDFSFLGRESATAKLSCVYREAPVPAGRYSYTCYSVVGTLKQVTEGIDRLLARFP